MITSAQNPRIKALAQLMDKSRKRREEGLFVIEGLREAGIALQSGYRMQCLYYCPDILPDPFRHLPSLPADTPAEALSAAVYEKLAYRGTTEGVLAVFHEHPMSLEDIPLNEAPLVIVLEGVEKPGNLGAILRTADAAGASAVLLCDPLTDLYNPNTIRASLGCLFSVPTVTCTNEQACSWLNHHGFLTVAANCQATQGYYQCDLTGPTAFIMGTEDKGLGPFWRQQALRNIKIPMLGRIDSLNVSVATAVLCFEAVRQRAERNNII